MSLAACRRASRGSRQLADALIRAELRRQIWTRPFWASQDAVQTLKNFIIFYVLLYQLASCPPALDQAILDIPDGCRNLLTWSLGHMLHTDMHETRATTKLAFPLRHAASKCCCGSSLGHIFKSPFGTISAFLENCNVRRFT